MANLVTNEFVEKEFNVIFDNTNSNKTITKEYFLANFPALISRYISNGNPSLDTKRSYISAISQFLAWCKTVRMDPFNINEQHMIYYRSVLNNNGYKPASMKFKLTAVRRFFDVAIKYKLTEVNPVADIHAQRDPDAYMPVVKFLTEEQLQYLIDALDIPQGKNKLINLRTLAIIFLMAKEGLRTVEVQRMNVEDINFNLATIYIRGKGHNDMIFPSEITMFYLKKYIEARQALRYNITPVFTSLSNNSLGRRMSRQNIRLYINKALEIAGFKAPGKSCHMLRHTCGTLLYAKTNNIRAVQDTLRHRSIEMTSKYSHIQDAMLKRYTNAIPIKPPKDI